MAIHKKNLPEVWILKHRGTLGPKFYPCALMSKTLPGYCKLTPPLKTARLFFGKSCDLENSAVRLFFGEISPNLSERLFTIFFQYFS